MSGMTDSAEKWILDFLTGRVTPHYVASRTTYLGLLTTAPASTDPTLASLVEPTSSAGYARQAVTWAAPSTDVNGVTTTANSLAVLLGPFTGSGGLAACVYAFLTTAASGTSGDVVELFPLAASLTAAQNESVQVSIGALVLSQF